MAEHLISGETQQVLEGRYVGTLDKFEGDAMPAFFGAPEFRADDAARAVRAAAEMQRAFRALRVDWAERHALDVSRLGVGIGVATGDGVVGSIGSRKRR